METLKYITNALIQFFKSSNATTKENAASNDNVEITHTKFGINLKRAPTSGNVSSSLLTLMYSEENETLFI
jgi:hypothetical protein